ncbi:putative glutathione S-transferase [Cryptosporidium felis]|nr:putative glutathione S-transferase [Cryptosporidium felis]
MRIYAMRLKLFYCLYRGTCDVIRLLLIDQEIPYEEHNISGKDFLQPEFQQVLQESGNFPMLPYLSDSDNEVELTGSFTILRYLAERCRLMGSTLEERSRVENWLEFLLSLLHSVWEFENTSDGYQAGAQKSKKRSQFLLESLHPMLGNIENQVEPGNWALDFYSVADIVLYSAISVVIKYWGEDLLRPYIGKPGWILKA